MKQILSQDLKIVPILVSLDINAGVDCDSVDMQGMKSVSFLFTFGSDLSGDAILTINSGTTHGAKTTAMTFNYRYGGAAIGSALADVLSDIASSAALTLTGTTFVSRGLICEVNVDQITDGHRYITPSLSSAASAGAVHAWALLDPMYKDPGADSVID